jgi:hypothetical protein
VAFACGTRGATGRAVRFHTGRVKGQRFQVFSARLRRPRGCRRARRGVVTVAYGGNQRQVRQVVTAGVRHR